MAQYHLPVINSLVSVSYQEQTIGLGEIQYPQCRGPACGLGETPRGRNPALRPQLPKHKAAVQREWQTIWRTAR